MKRTYKFSVVILLTLTALLSGCIFPGDGWDRGDRGEHRDHGRDHGGDRGGEHEDHR